MTRKSGWAAVVLLALSTPTLLSSAELRPETLAAWNRYLATVDARIKTAPATQNVFLWLDEDRDRAERVHRGEVAVSQVKSGIAHGVPHGLIHDWIGAIFVPEATVADVIAMTHDYDDYPKWYGPTISQAHLLSSNGDEDRFTIRYVRTVLWVTAVIEIEYETHYFREDSKRWYSVTRSTRIQEIEEHGQPGERKITPDHGSGYLWRAYSVSKYEQRDGGVYIEQENIGLSRRIPESLRWIVEPVVRRLSRELLERSLEQTREAVRSKSGK